MLVNGVLLRREASRFVAGLAGGRGSLLFTTTMPTYTRQPGSCLQVVTGLPTPEPGVLPWSCRQRVMVVAGDGLQDQGRLAPSFDTVYATTAAGPVMRTRILYCLSFPLCIYIILVLFSTQFMLPYRSVWLVLWTLASYALMASVYDIE